MLRGRLVPGPARQGAILATMLMGESKWLRVLIFNFLHLQPILFFSSRSGGWTRVLTQRQIAIAVMEDVERAVVGLHLAMFSEFFLPHVGEMLVGYRQWERETY